MGLTFCKRSDNVLMQDFPKLYFFQFSIIMLFMMGSLECLHNNLTLVVYCSLSSKKLLQQKCWSKIDQHLLEEREDQKRRQALSQIVHCMNGRL